VAEELIGSKHQKPTEVGSKTSEEKIILSESAPESLERLVSAAASLHSFHNRHCRMVRSFDGRQTEKQAATSHDGPRKHTPAAVHRQPGLFASQT